jgi:hypothetical protein
MQRDDIAKRKIVNSVDIDDVDPITTDKADDISAVQQI